MSNATSTYDATASLPGFTVGVTPSSDDSRQYDQVGHSGTATSNEVITLMAPAAGTYRVCLAGYAPDGGSASYTLASWVVGSSDVGGKLKVSLPSSVFVGGTASAVASWSVLTADQRYMGAVQFLMNGTTPLSTMLMEVDATNPVPVPGPPPGTGLAAGTTKTLRALPAGAASGNAAPASGFAGRRAPVGTRRPGTPPRDRP